MIQRMVLGFMFDESLKRVALIKKENPAWQRGLLNGIGGKCEYKESAFESIVREFHEETGLKTDISDWTQFCFMIGGDWSVDCFHAVGPIDQLLTTTIEEVVIIQYVDLTNPAFFPMMSNLYWLIPMALNHRTTEHKFTPTIIYGD